MLTFDLIVIGSGSGLEISSEAAARGQSVAVIESGPFGGTCLNRGCIPSKMLIHSADVAETIKRAGLFGIDAELKGVDWKFIIDRAANEVDGDAQSIEQGNREHPNITVFKGRGRFVGPKTLQVGGEQLTAETIVIAAGTRPRVPEIDGMESVTYLTSDEALRLPAQPRRLVIIGGGHIAAELSHFYGALGTEVTIVHRRPVLLREENDSVSKRFTAAYQRRFDVRLNATVRQVRQEGEDITVEIDGESSPGLLAADALLLATSRVPNTDELAVERAGVRVDERGFVQADEFLETSVPGIWTLGDIAYGSLVHVALYTGLRLSELTGLRWQDVDADRAVLHVRQTCQWLPRQGFSVRQPKSYRGTRPVALAPPTVDRLRQYRRRQLEERLAAGPSYHDHDLVFADPVGQPVLPSNLRAAWKRIRRATGLSVRVHDLRHAHASFLLAQGIHPKIGSERLGRSQISITLDLYSHTLPHLQAEAAAAFADWLANG